MNITETRKAAAEIRKLTIAAMQSAGYGHIGGSMSIADVLAVLYTDIMRVDPKNPRDPNRDWLVLSKGHCAPGLCAALAHKGYFPKEEVLTLNQNGTRLPSHCDRLKTPGVDISTGSLGQGISMASGVALGNAMQGINSHVYVILGDGELNEGQNWETAQFLAHRQMDNITVIVDANQRQLDGYTEDVCKQFDIAEKFRAFGLHTLECDGHDVRALHDALVQKPAVLVMHTEKGHGCNFAEIPGFNHYMVITDDMARAACEEIDRRLTA
ncbi:MAG: transketolase [Oscillospiraceae bacterium]|nr:transketolase [Oscillospiraceae bacterium]